MKLPSFPDAFSLQGVRVDTIAFSMRGELSNEAWLQDLVSAPSYKDGGTPRRILLGGLPFELRSNPPSSKYRFHLSAKIPTYEGKNVEILRIELAPKCHYLPPIYAYVRSPLLHKLGAQPSLDFSQELTAKLFRSSRPLQVTLSRVDLYVDVFCPRGFSIPLEAFLTRARVSPCKTSALPGCSFEIGSRRSPKFGRIYPKTVSLRLLSSPPPHPSHPQSENGSTSRPGRFHPEAGFVLRVEFQLNRRFYADRRIEDLETLLRQAPDLWHELTHCYLRIVEDRKRKTPSAFWRVVQAAEEHFRNYCYCDARKRFRSSRSQDLSPLLPGEPELLRAHLLQEGLPSDRRILQLWARSLASSQYNLKTIGLLTGRCEKTVRAWLHTSSRTRPRGRPLARPHCRKLLQYFLDSLPHELLRPRILLPLLEACDCPYPRATLYRHIRAIRSSTSP